MTNFCELCSPRSRNSDELASAPPPQRRTQPLPFGSRTHDSVDVGSACVDIRESPKTDVLVYNPGFIFVGPSPIVNWENPKINRQTAPHIIKMLYIAILLHIFCIHYHTFTRRKTTWRRALSCERCERSLTHFTHSKMGTVTEGFDARLANRPFLVFDFRALWRSSLSPTCRKSKTKNGRLASLASNPLLNPRTSTDVYPHMPILRPHAARSCVLEPKGNRCERSGGGPRACRFVRFWAYGEQSSQKWEIPCLGRQ